MRLEGVLKVICADAWLANMADAANSTDPNKARDAAKASGLRRVLGLRGMSRSFSFIGASISFMEGSGGGCVIEIIIHVPYYSRQNIFAIAFKFLIICLLLLSWVLGGQNIFAIAFKFLISYDSG